MPEGSNGNLLWIDDDAPERFKHEHRLLSRHGWSVTWATSAMAGAEALRDTSFNAVILDQMLPWKKGTTGTDPEEVWAGCLLFCWLRDRQRPSKAPPRKDFERLYTMAPLATNLAVPVILSSAYFDEDIMTSLQEIEPHLPELPKPIDCDRLLELVATLVR
jgi:CheY-like chemotaxis protein